MSLRRDTYADRKRRLERTSDAALMQLLASADATPGLGCARVVEFGDSLLFTKSIPLTSAERARPYCTENLFELPAVYHYGVGSAGFGAFRELAVHVKTTEWVLSGAIDNFPLLYHHRVLPLSGETIAMEGDELDDYIEYWDGSAAVRNYVEARQQADCHLVLFVEHLPQQVLLWLDSHLPRIEAFSSAIRRTLDFLHERGVGHFDAHLGNIMTDGDQFFLTDFGLAIDREFELDSDERQFFESHRNYDAGEFIRSLYRPARKLVEAWDDDTVRRVSEQYGDATFATVLGNLEPLAQSGALPLPLVYRDALSRNRRAYEIMDRVFSALHSGPKHAGGYDDEELGRALASEREP